MKALAVVLGMWMLAGTATAAEIARLPGRLTILSRPSGASFQLSGDRLVLGRTPSTIPSLAGRFSVKSLEPGFEPWRRSVVLDGTSSDTLWMVLHEKSILMAGVRSLVVPGWGQFYSSRPTAGWVALSASFAAAGTALAMHIRYENRLDEYDRAVGFAAQERAAQRAQDAYDDRRLAVGIASGIWGLNVVEAILRFPRFRGAPDGGVGVGMSAEPTPEGVRSALTLRARLP